MSDIKNAIESGVAGATTGAGLAGTAAAIAAAASLAIPPPFGEMAAPFAAALGAMIGFFVFLGGKSKQDAEARRKRLDAAFAAHSKILQSTAGTGPAILAAAKSFRDEFGYLAKGASLVGKGVTQEGLQFQVDEWLKKSDAARTLTALASQFPQYAPMVNEMFSGARIIVSDYKNCGAHLANMQKVADFIAAIGSMPGDLSADPFAYLRPPLSTMFGPALGATNINIANPDAISIMRGNYDMAQQGYDFSEAKWGGFVLDTSMNIYGGPTEADRQIAESVAKKFAGGGNATPIYNGGNVTSPPNSISPLWYLGGAAVALGAGYYFLNK